MQDTKDKIVPLCHGEVQTCLSFLYWRESHVAVQLFLDNLNRRIGKGIKAQFILNIQFPHKMSDKGELDFTFQEVADVWRKFYKDALFFAQKCKKPDRREFMVMFQATMIGFSVMGFMGCLVRLVSIPVKKFLIP